MGKSLNPMQLIGSGLGAASDIYRASREEKMYYDNLNWQKEQYYDSQNFSREQADTQWQREKEMFNMENEYNSAASQVQRYKDAGLNPAVMMQGNAASVASGGAASVGQSVAPPQLQMDNLPTGAAGAIGSAMSHAGDIMKGLADAKKAGIDVSLAEETFDDMVRKIKNDADAVDVDNALKGWQLFTDKVFGFKIKNKEIEKLSAEVNLLIANGQVSEAQKLLNDEMRHWYKGQADRQDKYNEKLDTFIYNELKLGEEQIKTEQTKQDVNRSTVTANNAAANASNAAAALSRAGILVAHANAEEIRSRIPVNAAAARELGSRAEVNKATVVSVQEYAKLSQAQRFDLISKNYQLYMLNNGQVGLSGERRKHFINNVMKTMDENLRAATANADLAEQQYYLNIYQAVLDGVNTGANAYNKVVGPAAQAAGYAIW